MTNQQKCHFSAVFASFLIAVWFCIYSHAQLSILKFQESVYQKAEVCAQTKNEWRKSKRTQTIFREFSKKYNFKPYNFLNHLPGELKYYFCCLFFLFFTLYPSYRCDNDNTIKRTEKTTSRLRFNFEGFRFLSSVTNAIFLHCQAKSCSGNCTVSCGGSRKRRSIYDADLLHVGTVQINIHPDAG